MERCSSRAMGSVLIETALSEKKNIMHLAPKSQSIRVENFVTHNGKHIDSSLLHHVNINSLLVD